MSKRADSISSIMARETAHDAAADDELAHAADADAADPAADGTATPSAPSSARSSARSSKKSSRGSKGSSVRRASSSKQAYVGPPVPPLIDGLAAPLHAASSPAPPNLFDGAEEDVGVPIALEPSVLGDAEAAAAPRRMLGLRASLPDATLPSMRSSPNARPTPSRRRAAPPLCRPTADAGPSRPPPVRRAGRRSRRRERRRSSLASTGAPPPQRSPAPEPAVEPAEASPAERLGWRPGRRASSAGKSRRSPSGNEPSSAPKGSAASRSPCDRRAGRAQVRRRSARYAAHRLADSPSPSPSPSPPPPRPRPHPLPGASSRSEPSSSPSLHRPPPTARRSTRPRRSASMASPSRSRRRGATHLVRVGRDRRPRLRRQGADGGVRSADAPSSLSRRAPRAQAGAHRGDGPHTRPRPHTHPSPLLTLISPYLHLHLRLTPTPP